MFTAMRLASSLVSRLAAAYLWSRLAPMSAPKASSSTAAVAPRNSPHMLKSQTALFAAARQGFAEVDLVF